MRYRMIGVAHVLACLQPNGDVPQWRIRRGKRRAAFDILQARTPTAQQYTVHYLQPIAPTSEPWQ